MSGVAARIGDVGDWRSALINGLAVVLGGAVAAVAGVVGPLATADRQAGREEKREESRTQVQARGAARVLLSEMLVAAGQMAILEHDRIYRRFEPSYRVNLPPSDLKLVASRLAVEQWGHVMAALHNTDGLETFVNTRLERGRRRLTPADRCLVRADIRSIRIAARSLAPLADAPGNDEPIEPIDCSRYGRAFDNRSSAP